MCFIFLARLIHLIFARKINHFAKKKMKFNRARKLERIASPSNQTVSIDTREAICLDFLG